MTNLTLLINLTRRPLGKKSEQVPNSVDKSSSVKVIGSVLPQNWLVSQIKRGRGVVGDDTVEQRCGIPGHLLEDPGCDKGQSTPRLRPRALGLLHPLG